MPVLTPEKMPDAVIATMDSLNRDKWIGEMASLSDYVGFRRFCKDRKERRDGSRGIKLRYVMDHNHSAQHTGLYGTVDFGKDNAIVEGEVRWTYSDANMIFDRRESDINSGPEAVVDLVKVEQARALTSLIELLEKDVWGCPENADDNATPFGIGYWLTKNAALGFNGGDPVVIPAGRAGISSVTYPRHKNFTGAYKTIDDTAGTGLVNMMEVASAKTNFVAPAPEPGMGGKENPARGIFCKLETKLALKNVAKANNDSLGFDLATTDPVFRGAKIEYVPAFENRTDDPLYMLDFNTIYAMFLKDWNMKKTVVNQLLDRPYCFGILMSMVWNIVCSDLRRQTVFHKA